MHLLPAGRVRGQQIEEGEMGLSDENKGVKKETSNINTEQAEGRRDDQRSSEADLKGSPIQDGCQKVWSLKKPACKAHEAGGHKWMEETPTRTTIKGDVHGGGKPVSECLQNRFLVFLNQQIVHFVRRNLLANFVCGEKMTNIMCA